MKTIIILSDIHSNLQALTSTLSNIERSENDDFKIIVNGDVIGLGPEPVECIELLKQYPKIEFIMGNNDRYVVDRIFQSGEPFHTALSKELPHVKSSLLGVIHL